MITLEINGNTYNVDVDPSTPLLWVIRDNISLTGTKYGCGQGLCGACTVHFNNQPIRACVTPVSVVAGGSITTIEGLDSKEGQAVQAAWEKLEVAQCGYCQSGQIMTATALLQSNATPTEEDITDGMSGNICRCATYHRVRSAVKEAANTLASTTVEETV